MKWEVQTSALNCVSSLVTSITTSFLRQPKAVKGHQCLLPRVGSHTVLLNFLSGSAVNMNTFKGTFMGFIFNIFIVILGDFLSHKVLSTKFNIASERNVTIITIHPFLFFFLPLPSLSPSSLSCSPLLKPLSIMLLLYLTTVMNYDSVLRVTVTQHKFLLCYLLHPDVMQPIFMVSGSGLTLKWMNNC